jgi:hypothetical protein
MGRRDGRKAKGNSNYTAVQGSGRDFVHRAATGERIRNSLVKSEHVLLPSPASATALAGHFGEALGFPKPSQLSSAHAVTAAARG